MAFVLGSFKPTGSTPSFAQLHMNAMASAKASGGAASASKSSSGGVGQGISNFLGGLVDAAAGVGQGLLQIEAFKAMNTNNQAMQAHQTAAAQAATAQAQAAASSNKSNMANSDLIKWGGIALAAVLVIVLLMGLGKK